jgi:hypothetical protein
MFRGSLMFFSVVVGLVAQAQMSNMLSPSIDYPTLKGLIQSKKIKRVDDLLPHLPMSMRKNPIFVYESHALNQHLVTPATPRTILFNEDGSLILAFTQHPGDQKIAAGEDTLEVIRFNSRSFKYEMRNLVMDGKKTPFQNQEPQVNPTLCLSCHGSNPRPIFQDYNAWPGIYGSFGFSGLATVGSLEYQNFDQFMANQRSLPRYKSLDVSAFKKTDLGWVLNATGSRYGSPVPLFATTIQRNMEFRLAAKMLQHPAMAKFENLITYLGSDLYSCGNIRDRIKNIYGEIVTDSEKKLAAEQLLEKIRNQSTIDFQKKKSDFLKTNLPHESEDLRGVLNIVYSNLMNIYDPYYSVDAKSYENQVVLLEAIAQAFGLTSEDTSSFPMAPSLGMTHILRMGLFKDEQFLLGITEAMLAMNVFSLPRLENECDRIKAAATQETKLLEVPLELNIFKPALTL